MATRSSAFGAEFEGSRRGSSGVESPEALPLLCELDEGIRAGLSKVDFLRAIDARQPLFYEIFCDHYHDSYYAKLLCLKMANYIVAKYHFVSRHVVLVSKPVTLMVDPSNGCQLRCPGCVHSANWSFVRNLVWPAGVMKTETFRGLLETYGPFALNAVLYNYGEPLLNKRIADFVVQAHGYAMTTHLSTNLSLKFDVESFVRAEPDHVILSIDGITQETYSKFRKRGDLSLVLANLRKMVQVKRKHGLHRPILAWRFFPFEHNVHEVDDAIAMAEEIGVDHIIIGSPFDVSADDPEVRTVQCDRRGRHDFIDATPWQRSRERALERLVHCEEVERLFEQGWSSHARAAEPDEPRKVSPHTCVWLYYNLTADAVGRIMPCCMAPTTNKHLVYGSLSQSLPELFNAEDFSSSRLSFADRPRFEMARAASARERMPHCGDCPGRVQLTYGVVNGVSDLGRLDFEAAVIDLEREFWWHFSKWG